MVLQLLEDVLAKASTWPSDLGLHVRHIYMQMNRKLNGKKLFTPICGVLCPTCQMPYFKERGNSTTGKGIHKLHSTVHQPQGLAGKSSNDSFLYGKQVLI